MNLNRVYSTVDTHIFGEAFRIVVHSSMRWLHETIEEAQAHVMEQFQFERNILLNEPRGHRGMNGCLVCPSTEAQFGLAFFNHPDSTVFKQEALLAATTALIEMGTIERTEDDRYQVETAYGTYTITAKVEDGEVVETSMFVDASEVVEKTEAFTKVRVGDNRFYRLYVLPPEIPTIDVAHLGMIERWGATITKQLKQAEASVEGIVLIEEFEEGHVRTVTFEKDGYILRSPGIDVTCAILAVENVQRFTNTSIFHSTLSVEQLTTTTGKIKQLVRGEAFVTGSHDFLVDADDPLQNGFLLA